MLRRLPVLLALLILLVAIPWKAMRLIPRLLHRAQTPSELFSRPPRYEQYLQLRLESAKELGAARLRPEYQEAAAQIRQSAQQPDAEASRVIPTRLQGTTALVTDRNTRWQPERVTLISEFRVDLAGPSTDSTCSLQDTPAARLVNSWIREGSAAGHHGILYDNRDRGHSTLERAQWPELAFVRYSPEIRAAGGDFGFRPWQRFNLPTFGNASTALVNPVFWRSNPRAMLGNQLHATLMLEHYLSNQLYCTPEHNDFDAPHGDVYPANAPCWIISQGSSGSDQPFLRAIALTLAAFPPETRSRLEGEGVLMHAVQWVLRQSQRSVRTADDFFTGFAHPAVFREQQLDVERMVRLAHEMSVDRMPPLVRLQVVEESKATHGVHYFSGGPGEELLTHPLLVARIHRTVARKRRMLVQASATSSVQPHSNFRWVVLQGDPASVEIRPLNPEASMATVTFNWQPTHPVTSAPELSCSRVDIGVFTEANGVPSMPAMICSLAIPAEERVYAGDRLVSVDYADPKTSQLYCDPLLVPVRNWKDTYQYDSTGRIAGWTRTAPGQQPQQFNAAGELVSESGGTAAVPRSVQYRLQEAPEKRPVLLWEPR